MKDQPALDTVNVSGKDIKAAVTADCVILTVIDQRTEWTERNPLLEHLTESELRELGHQMEISRRGGIDVREHDSVVKALKYLDQELRDDTWDRAYIINPTRLRYTEKPKRGRRK